MQVIARFVLKRSYGLTLSSLGTHFILGLLPAWREQDVASCLRRWMVLLSAGWLLPYFTSSRSCLYLTSRVDWPCGLPRIAWPTVLLTDHPHPAPAMPIPGCLFCVSDPDLSPRSGSRGFGQTRRKRWPR